jgi:hypothetical protein
MQPGDRNRDEYRHRGIGPVAEHHAAANTVALADLLETARARAALATRHLYWLWRVPATSASSIAGPRDVGGEAVELDAGVVERLVQPVASRSPSATRVVRRSTGWGLGGTKLPA